MYNVIQYHNVSFYAEKTHISYVDKILDEEYTNKAWWPSPSRSVPRVHGTMSRQWSHTHVPVLQGRYSTQLSHEREVNTLSSCGYYILRRKASRYISSTVTDPKVHGPGFSLGIIVMIPECFNIKLLSCSTALNTNPELNAVVTCQCKMIIFFGIKIKFLRSSDIVVRVTGIAQQPHCLLY